MNVMGIVIIALVCAATVLGFIVGLCKGFAKVKSWGIDYLLATFVTIGVGGLLGNGFGNDDEGAAAMGIVSLVIGVAAILLFSMTSAFFRKGFVSSKKKKIARGSKKSGPSGFFDSVFGGVTLAAKGFVIAGALSAFLLVVADLSQLPALTGMTGDIFESGAWAGFKPLLMDFFVMAAMMAAIRSGFNSGISSVLWAICMIGMVAFTAYAAYHLAFEAEACQGAVNSFAASLAGEGAVGDTQIILAKVLLTAIFFLLMLVVVILIGVFVPRLLAGARNGSAFFVIDGIFGALFAFVLAVGALLFAGSVLQPISNGEEFPFMANFTSYFEASRIATFFYDKNIMCMYGMPSVIPLKEWLAPKA